MKKHAAAILALAGACISAHAQCAYDLALVPDFDQRRLNALPGNGSMYCVPTSVTNWFAYFANRGIPQPNGLAGPRNWQSNFNYDRASEHISIMGMLMQTSAADGTTGGKGRLGAEAYSYLFAQNKIIVTHYWCGGGFCPSPAAMGTIRLLGGYIAPCYGHYSLSGANNYTRNGGHCITAVGQTGCTSGSQLKFRDPASDSLNSTQSTFLTHYATMTQVTANFRSNSSQSYVQDTRWRLDYGTNKFLDGWYVLWPTVALTAEPSFLNPVIIRPAPLLGTQQPPVQSFPPTPGGAAIMSMAMHPQMMEVNLVVQGTPASPVPKILRLDLGAQTYTQLLTGDFRLLVFNRHDELYASDGTTIKRYRFENRFPVQISSFELPAIPESMAFDDENDTIGVVIPTAVPTRKQFLRLPRNLAATLPGSGLLPGTAATIQGRASLDFKPGTNEVFIAGEGLPVIHIITSSTAGLVHQGEISLPTGSLPTEVNVDEAGHVYYLSGGIVHELMQSASGAWIPNPESIFQGRAASRFFKLAKSRTNHDRLVHEGPSYYNIADPEVPPGIPDCYANCDFSTTPPILNVADFSCFLTKFAAGDPDANCDFSTSPPILNVADFSCFLTAFAAGCPQ
jgi:hypothetical protein